MTNKIDEIKHKIRLIRECKYPEDKLQGMNLVIDVDELLDQLDLKTEKDELLIELGKLVANNEENAGYLLCDARYMYPDLTTLNRMEELIKQIGGME